MGQSIFLIDFLGATPAPRVCIPEMPKPKDSMTRYVRFLSSIFLAFPLVSSGQDSSLFSFSNSSQYAHHLFSIGDYHTAFTEYKRLTFLDSLNVEFKTNSLAAAYLSGQYLEGIKQARTYYTSDSLFPNSVARAYIHLLFKVDAPLRLQTFLSANNYLNPNDKTFYSAANQMLDNRMAEAQLLLGKVSIEQESGSIQDLRAILIQENRFKPKSAGLAGIMSAIVPGSGKAYAGQWKDGLLSFVYVGLSAFQSYRGFNERGIESAYGWIFAGVSTGFYAGNIYGSVRAIHKRRNNHRDQINQQITHAIENHY